LNKAVSLSLNRRRSGR